MIDSNFPQGITLVRNGVFGHEDYGSSYLIEGESPALLDPGTSRSVPRLLDWFEASTYDLSDLDSLLLTHVHLDHCGGTGRLVEEVPDLKVYLHERGSRHLEDPSDLLASVEEATGNRFDQYGDLEPVPSENLFPIGERRTLDVGGRELVALPTPGHAPHHLAYYDKKTGSLFTGDGAGLYLDGMLIPSTPPPTFNLELSLESLEKMKGLDPSTLLFSHFGPGENPSELLHEYHDVLASWVKEVDDLNSLGLEGEELMDRIVQSHAGWVRKGFSRDELEMNIHGVLEYLDWREDARS